MRPGTHPTLDRAIQDVLAGAEVIARQTETADGRAAGRALQAALTLLLHEVRPCVLPGARAQALSDLSAAVAKLRGDDAGTTAMPARYDTGDRETLDRIRDLLGDGLYVGGCLFNVIKYLDRRGKKGDPAQDEAKALFYLQAAAHVLLGFPDPRCRRPTFQPYQRGRSAWPAALFDLLPRLDDGIPFGDHALRNWTDLLAKISTIQERL